jgi:hypothetical protein
MILAAFLQIVRWVNTVLTVIVFTEVLNITQGVQMKTEPRRTARNGPTFLHIISSSLTSWSRVLPEKLTVPQPVKKFTVFDGTRKFITLLITARLENHLLLISP